MKLIHLEAEFLGGYTPNSHRSLPTANGAQGVMFTCPKCGNHSIICWFKNPRNASEVPPEAFPGPGRWTFTGDTIDALTLTPSVDLSKIDDQNPAHPSRCYWHGHVTNGEAA